MATTVGKGLIYPALRMAGVTLGPQRTPSPAQYEDGLEELNRLVGSLNLDRLNITTSQLLQFPLTAGDKTYTIGQDPANVLVADFPVSRPVTIEAANIMMGTPPIRFPLAIVTELQWAAISYQDIVSIPQVLYIDQAYPISTMYLYPAPTSGCSLELYVWQVIPTFATTDDTVTLSPGYEDMLVLNLAVRLMPQFQRELRPDVVRDAQLSLMRLQSINAPQPVLGIEWGGTGNLQGSIGAYGCGGGH